MPRLVHSVPKYRLHKASGQAVVTIAGRDRYLGPYGSKTSKVEYDRLILEWLASSRHTVTGQREPDLTITELVARYWRFANGHYRKNGEARHQGREEEAVQAEEGRCDQVGFGEGHGLARVRRAVSSSLFKENQTMPRGRQSRLTSELIDAICERIRVGTYPYVAAAACGVPRST